MYTYILKTLCRKKLFVIFNKSMKNIVAFFVLLTIFLLTATHVRADRLQYLPASPSACLIQKPLAPTGKRIITEPTLPVASQEARVTWYGREACIANGTIYGTTCKTANGETFSEDAYTLASHTLPLGVSVELSYNGNRVICRSTDRVGNPYVDFDLSLGCAKVLGIVSKGKAVINYRLLP